MLAGAAMVASVAIPELSGQAIDAVQAHHSGSLRTVALLVALAGLLRLVLSAARRLVAGRVSLGVEYDLRNLMFRQLQSLELAFFDHQQTGQLMSRVTVDLQAIRFFLGYGLVFIVQSGLAIVLAGVAMLVIDPSLAAIALAPVPFVVYATNRYSRLARPALQEVQQRIGELTADVQENIAGVRVVKAFARETHQRARFERSVAARVRTVDGRGAPAGSLQPADRLLAAAGACRDPARRRPCREPRSVEVSGQFSAFYIYLLMLLSPMRTLGISLGMAQRATASGARVFELLDRAPQLTSPPGAPPLPRGDGRVQLEGVTMRDGTNATAALHDVDLEIAAGRTVALVGATGSGKTTLAALVARLYDPSSGRVRSTAPTCAASTSPRCVPRSR